MIDITKYVVLDLETNGLDSERDDLLSISFYMPDTELKYERYLPLELNAHVDGRAKEINGISEEILVDKKPLTQEEFNNLVISFDLERREILHYGKIDQTFLKKYMERHNLKGFDKLVFHNIKRHFVTPSYIEGLFSKDNLCKAFGITGVNDVHNGLNDCILEWKLFSKTNNNYLICDFIDNCDMGFYEIPDDYYIPVSKIRYFPHLKYVRELPKLRVEYEEIFRMSVSGKCKFYTGSNPQPLGVACEKLIKSMLDAKDVKDVNFARLNFKKLKLINKYNFFDRSIREILVKENGDGTLSAVNDEDSSEVNSVNKLMLKIKKEIEPLTDFIKQEIFHGNQICAQELVKNNDLKTFGYTDFSNDDACLEMKFSDSLVRDYEDANHPILNRHNYQFYFLSKNRPMYLLLGGCCTFIIAKINFHVGEKDIREYISNKRAPFCKTVSQYARNGKKIGEFETTIIASKQLGISLKAIRDNCNGRSKLCHGYQFKYKGSSKKIVNLNK